MAETMPPGSDNDPQARRTDRTKRVGAYAKLLANYASDDALIEAGEAAELLFVRGLAFCATSDADGFITDAQVVRYVGAGMRDAMKRADRLAVCGPWIRVDGGFIVRSWTKIHDTTAEKGRRRKADRERKRKTPESETPSEQSPGGIPEEAAPESLSLIHDTAPHDTAMQDTDVDLRVVRTETLRVVPDTEHPKNEAVCSRHPNGNPTGEACGGCKRVEERRVREDARAAQKAADLAAEVSRNCPDCEGTGKVLDGEKRPTRRACSHPRSRVSSSGVTAS